MPSFRQIEPYETLIFQHLPKAAGSTLRQIMKSEFPASQRYHIYPGIRGRCQKKYDKFAGLPIERRKQIHYIEGHMRFGIHQHVSQSCVYITLLRHPVERLISNYYYILTRPNHHLYDLVAKMTLDDFIESEPARKMHNGQTRAIAGKTLEEFILLETPEEVLDIAYRNIEKYFALVGLTEQFDTSLILLKHALAWEELPLYTRRNVTQKNPKREAIADKTIDLIRQHNTLDCRLYDEMKTRFESVCEAMTGLDEEVSEFKEQNAVFNERAFRRRLPKPIQESYNTAKHLARHVIGLYRKIY